MGGWVCVRACVCVCVFACMFKCVRVCPCLVVYFPGNRDGVRLA